jgi:hypothetical protein
MEIINKKEYDKWKTNQKDPYSQRCFSYAEEWANLILG